MKDTTYKTTAIALQNRRLATVTKEARRLEGGGNGGWSAFRRARLLPSRTLDEHLGQDTRKERDDIVAGETDHPGTRRSESHCLAPG